MENYKVTGGVSDFVFENIHRIPSLKLKLIQVEGFELKTKQNCGIDIINSFIDKQIRGIMHSSRLNSNPQGFCLPGVGSIQWKKLNFLDPSPETNKAGVNEFLDAVQQMLYTPIPSP